MRFVPEKTRGEPRIIRMLENPTEIWSVKVAQSLIQTRESALKTLNLMNKDRGRTGLLA